MEQTLTAEEQQKEIHDLLSEGLKLQESIAGIYREFGVYQHTFENDSRTAFKGFHDTGKRVTIDSHHDIMRELFLMSIDEMIHYTAQGFFDAVKVKEQRKFRDDYLYSEYIKASVKLKQSNLALRCIETTLHAYRDIHVDTAIAYARYEHYIIGLEEAKEDHKRNIETAIINGAQIEYTG